MSERLLVISDIHGHRKALATLLKRAKYNPKRSLVLMGIMSIMDRIHLEH